MRAFIVSIRERRPTARAEPACDCRGGPIFRHPPMRHAEFLACDGTPRDHRRTRATAAVGAMADAQIGKLAHGLKAHAAALTSADVIQCAHMARSRRHL